VSDQTVGTFWAGTALSQRRSGAGFFGAVYNLGRFGRVRSLIANNIPTATRIAAAVDAEPIFAKQGLPSYAFRRGTRGRAASSLKTASPGHPFSPGLGYFAGDRVRKVLFESVQLESGVS